MCLILASAALCGVFIFMTAHSPVCILPAIAALCILAGWSLLLLHQSRTDALTGLFNLRHLQAMAGHYRRCRRLTVFYIDLDRLKEVNDVRGHAAGDKLLTQLAEYLKNSASGQGEAYRIGGDEFLLILRKRDQIPALDSLSQFPASYGFAAGPGRDLDRLIREADTELYRNRGNL